MKRKRGKTWAMSEAAAPVSIQLGIAQSLPEALDDRDDLTVIGGIDPVIEMALNCIGIHQYSDFRDYSPETLAQTLLERAGIAVSAATIASQDWIGWAEMLAAENSSVGAVEADSPKTAAAIAENAHAQIAPSATVKEDDELALHVQEAKFTQVAMPAAKILRGEITCVVSGETTPPPAVVYVALCAQVYVINKITGEPKLMASRLTRLQPGEMNYFLLLEFEIPAIGVYQLQVVAFLLHPVAKVAFYQGPPLRVIA